MRVSDNAELGRYELEVDGDVVGFLDYEDRGGSRLLIHTEVDPDKRKRGYATALVAGALADVEARGLRAAPVCPFVVAYAGSHRSG